MFQFKQFTIQQDRTPMKVGTDGVLLGAWADVENAAHILDIGTGTGLIALMAAQRNSTAHIDALEIEPHACIQAQENVLASPWPQRITIIPTALQDFVSPVRYDCILCNPPFFSQSTKTPEQGRNLARHDDTLPRPVLLEQVTRLLASTGSFSLILPTSEAIKTLSYARRYHLFPQHITRVLPNPGKPPKRYLIKFSNTETIVAEDELVIELSRHHYSAEYIHLTQAFYLQMK